MKYFRFFLIAGVAFISLSSSTPRITQPSEGIYPGDLFPDFKNLESVSGTKINLSDLRGQKVLINLWAAYDALSHKENVLLSNVIEKGNYPVKMVSVSFDRSESIAERTIALDKIDNTYQLWANEVVHSNLFNLHQLDKGFKNYLIDEKGKIIAMNLSQENLDQLLKKN